MVNRDEEIEKELGRKKLMMRLPALRDQLRNASGEQIGALFMAYERAVAHQDRIRSQKHAPAQWTAYYEEVLREIEDGVVSYLAGQRWQDFS
ncbi:hypothetical protein ACIQUB_30790 [Rhizobium sp. NPDC090275]|uniref:hypothetical protein n=1 Tax=Rhizobium sp. NPDC090275 TaxID=3364498 RepID=UPI00383AC6DD